MIRKHVWKSLRKIDLGLTNVISDVIAKQEWLNPDLLTSVRLGPTLVITSDYGGAHKSSHYESLSFLVADLAFCWLWDDFRQKVRKRVLKDSRSMSYKELSSDKRRAKALVPFLRAANTIPGLLITFLIDKRIMSSFSEPVPVSSLSHVGKLSKWKQQPFGKLSRIGHLGAMLVAGLSAPGQNVLWFTDQDEIAPNAEKLTEATKVIGHYLNHYLPHDMGHFRFGTTKSDDGSMAIEDLAALPDLSAGATSEVMTHVFKNQGIPPNRLFIPLPEKALTKACTILGWIAGESHPLKKAIVCVDNRNGDMYSVRFLSVLTAPQNTDYDWRPQFQKYMQDKIIVSGATRICPTKETD